MVARVVLKVNKPNLIIKAPSENGIAKASENQPADKLINKSANAPVTTGSNLLTKINLSIIKLTVNRYS